MEVKFSMDPTPNVIAGKEHNIEYPITLRVRRYDPLAEIVFKDDNRLSMFFHATRSSDMLDYTVYFEVLPHPTQINHNIPYQIIKDTLKSVIEQMANTGVTGKDIEEMTWRLKSKKQRVIYKEPIDFIKWCSRMGLYERNVAIEQVD